MRIVLVNWARVWDGASVGGGANGYAQAVALQLRSMGHDVCWLCGGTVRDQAGTGGARAPVRIHRHPDWFGVRVFEVVNSPITAPSFDQFDRPLDEISQPALERAVADLIRSLAPDIVHIHNLEGFSAGCVSAMRDQGPAVVFSLHNYHTICPQVYLMQNHRTPCHDFASGARCEGCHRPPTEGRSPDNEPAAEPPTLDQPRAQSTPPATIAHSQTDSPGPLRRAWHRLWPTVDRPPVQHEAAPVSVPLTHDGLTVRSTLDAQRPMPMQAPDHRGTSAILRDELQDRDWPDPLDPLWQPLDNRPTRDPSFEPARCRADDAGLNRYARRRAAMISSLNACDRVLAVSQFVREKFQCMGVEPDRIETVTIGTRMTHTARRHAELVFNPASFADQPGRPIRLCFLGVNHWYKGLPMLADALELLTPQFLRRLDVTIVAHGVESVAWRFRRLEPRLARLTIAGTYQPHDVPYYCGGQDLGIVPSVWWDNGPQTVLEFLACGVPVLAANIGGIPDVIEHDVNGLLFRANDRFDLARTLATLADHPTRLDQLRAQVRPPKDMPTHAHELMTIYTDALERRRGAAAPSQPPPTGTQRAMHREAQRSAMP